VWGDITKNEFVFWLAEPSHPPESTLPSSNPLFGGTVKLSARSNKNKMTQQIKRGLITYYSRAVPFLKETF
jgi:hypothetical protein